jgi:predicted SAM-dependent methyltransferase
MEEPTIVKSDPKDYPFKKYIDECKHLDCDEHRHKIKPIVHIIDKDFKGQEHLFCDKSQRNAEGKFRRPKKLIEAEQRGFKSVAEMVEADKKAEEDKKLQEAEDLKKKLEKTQKDFDDYKMVTEERFNKLVSLIQASQPSKK